MKLINFCFYLFLFEISFYKCLIELFYFVQLLLEAPDDVFSFSFSPNEPNIVAGGCMNGQVALWDIGPWEERIMNPRSDHRDKNLFIV